MAPNKGTESIASHKPCKDEFEAARNILASCSPVEKRAKMEAMAGFLRRNTEASGNTDIAQSRGGDRHDYLVSYMAFQIGKSNNRTQHIKSASSTHRNIDDICWRTEWQLRKEFGDDRASKWLASGPSGKQESR